MKVVPMTTPHPPTQYEEIWECEWIEHKGGTTEQLKEIPPSLLKAWFDQDFSYALELRNGRIINFKGAEFNPGSQFATLDLRDSLDGHPFPRGIDVRISDIVWCGDAPDGS